MDQRDWHLWLCDQTTGRDALWKSGPEAKMRELMNGQAQIGRDVWLVDPNGVKHLPAAVDATNITTEQAYTEGEKANAAGYYKHNNPFLDNPACDATLEHLALQWDRGWDAGQAVREQWEEQNHERARAHGQ